MNQNQLANRIVSLYNDVFQYKTTNPIGSGSSKIYTLEGPSQSGTATMYQARGSWWFFYEVQVITDNQYLSPLCFEYEGSIDGVNFENIPKTGTVNGVGMIGLTSELGGIEMNINNLDTSFGFVYTNGSSTAPTFNLTLRCKSTVDGNIKMTRRF